jgi:hypothetical protein
LAQTHSIKKPKDYGINTAHRTRLSFIPFPFGFLATPPDEVAFFFFFSVFLSLLVIYMAERSGA